MADQDPAAPAPRTVPYKLLKRTHPEYDAGYWRRLRAFYEGGKRLLGDDDLLGEVFPKHRNERDPIYRERKSRALYVPYTAEIIDHLVAGIGADPVTMGLRDKNPEEAEIPPFYKDFFDDCSRPGGERVPFFDLLKTQMLTALQTRVAWTLVDLPPTSPNQFADAKEQEEKGALNAYAMAVEPEMVVDWEEDEESGELLWALIASMTKRRASLEADRNMVRERWMFYTPTTWQRFEIVYPEAKPPKPDDPVPVVAEGAHSFGAVQLVRLSLPAGLWAMNKLESLAREHFNKRNALAWGEFQSLLPELYEFLAPEVATAGRMIGEAQEDPGRALSQPRGQGFVQQRGDQDKAMYVGPDAAPFAHALESLKELRDDMHRVLHQMALSVDNSAAALGRSGDSKAQDKAATTVVLAELGRILRKHAEDVMRMVSRGRGDDALIDQWQATGAAKFDSVSVADEVALNTELEVLSIPSETFQRRRKQRLVRAVLGDDVSPEDLDAIDAEIEKNVTAEQVMEGPLGQRPVKPGRSPAAGAAAVATAEEA